MGSRDGHDAAELAAAFPGARVVCFEPNPDTVDLVRAMAEQHPLLDAIPCALLDTDGEVTFYKIDPAHTVTTWADGNPGASSLFEATGDYPFETYAQTATAVDGARGDSLISKGISPAPELIWIDVQGAELMVLEGLGRYIDHVELVSVELSLAPIYHGQALAPAVVSFLQLHGLLWHSVAHPSEWQFDAVFVRTGGADIRLRLRNQLWNWSLRSRPKPGIREPIPVAALRGPQSLRRRLRDLRRSS